MECRSRWADVQENCSLGLRVLGFDGWLLHGVMGFSPSSPIPRVRICVCFHVFTAEFPSPLFLLPPHPPDVTSVDVLEHSSACGPLLRTLGPKCDRLDPALWNLDRIDQRAPPLDGLYSFGSETLRGVGTKVYDFMATKCIIGRVYGCMPVSCLLS